MKRDLESKGFFGKNELAAGGSFGESSGKIRLSGSKSAKKWAQEGRTDPDASLAQAFLAGSDDAFIRLYAKYEVSLFYYCKRMLHNKPAAEDVFQESWARIFEASKGAKFSP